MEFPAGALTNVLNINGFSTIYWRLLYDDASRPQSPGPASPSVASHAGLLNLGQLKELELKLRNSRCLAAYLPKSFGILVFSTDPDFTTIQSLYHQNAGKPSRVISIGNTLLRSTVTASITSAELVKHLVTDPQTSLPVNSSLQENSLGLTATSNVEVPPSYSSFHEAFISAVTGAVSLNLTRYHDLTPLGSRTFFSATVGNSYGSGDVTSNTESGTTSLLATLDVEMTAAGSLLVTLRAVPQPGLVRLSPENHTLDMHITSHSMDLWLAPNGAIARFASEGGGISIAASPGLSGVSNYGDEGQRRLRDSTGKEWKQSVQRWLESFGIPFSNPEEESWSEVEVVSPLDTRPIINGMRYSGLEAPQFAIKRILWPSKLCFRRTSSPFPSGEETLRCIVAPEKDPLEFAETWVAGADSRNKTLQETGTAHQATEFQQQQQPKTLVTSPHKMDIPETLDSLARTVNFPDLQSANSVYPTPPDGALMHGLGTVPPSSDGIGASTGDGTYFAMSHIQNEAPPSRNNVITVGDSDVLMGGLAAQQSDYAIGSGLYDTGVDEEDLFGGMGEGNFDTKGITEDDFNFFDEPDFGDLTEGIDAVEPGQFPEQANFAKLETEVEPSHLLPPEDKSAGYEGFEAGGQDTSDPHPSDNATKDPQHSPSALSTKNLHEVPEEANPQPQEAPPSSRRQTLSPPLSPVEIKKILFSDQQLPPNYSNTPTSGDNLARKGTHYGPVSFQQKLNNSDLKYSSTGRFWFPPEGATHKAEPTLAKETSEIPTIGLPKRGKKPTKSLLGYTPNTNPDLSATDADRSKDHYSSSGESDESDDDSDILSEGDISPAFLPGGMKRKRIESNLDDSTTSSLEKLSLSNELVAGNRGSPEENFNFLGNFLSMSVDWSFAGFFSMQESQSPTALVRRENYIQLAQVLVDQVTQSSLNHKLDGLPQVPSLDHSKYSMHSLLQNDGDHLGQTSRLTLEDFITTPGTDLSQHTRQKQSNALQGSISKIPPPHLRIRRGNAFMEVLPPAISLWETFGLEPAKGKKNVISYCIHPHDAAEGAGAFLERMNLVYSSCNFGIHSRGSPNLTFGDGLVSWDAENPESTTYPIIMKAIRSICEVLGSILAKIPPSDENIVVYIVNPFANAVAMADLCSAFLFLFQKYVGDADRQNVRQLHELVLQIVPLDFVSSSESIVVPLQMEYLNLALEVYNRCPPQNPSCDLTGSASALSLAKSPPKTIDFKLLPDQPSPLQESRCLHVAYSLSHDQRWVTAAWTDKIGSFQMTMSYCLRNKGSTVSRLISSVRQEIWETSRDIMEKFQTRWKVYLIRDEPVDMEEIEAWVSFANQQNHTRPTKVELIVLSANIHPGLVLEIPSQLGSALSNIHAAPYTTTPVATPSPDPTSGAANAPTPTDQPFESESDTTLIDASDETWGAILSRRLNNSNTLLEYHPSLASGYLIRRKGISDNDGVVAMGINLIHVQHGHGTHSESLLKEVLHMYRDLGTLARAKGLSHVRNNTLPWHIASAVKGQETMSYVL
ncbi:mediator of RNA polymerase II transcription subunit 13 [Arachnomyces sp. PD_36]|nr:mediator of RNA polymerase II transcription subunit 13 [Arachnomyces sp. PD_36]